MGWQLSGRSVELCSCKMLCPCWLGPEGTPDQGGWCGGTLVRHSARQFRRHRSRRNQGRFHGGWPRNFFGGQGTARFVHRRECKCRAASRVEPIFSGKKGWPVRGLWGAVISNWLPPRRHIRSDGASRRSSGSKFRTSDADSLEGSDGKPTRMEGAAAQAAFQFASMDLAQPARVAGV